MKTIRHTIILAIFVTLLSSTTTWGQKFKSIDEIYATTDTICGTYIPIDLQDALRVLDTLFSKEKKEAYKNPLGYDTGYRYRDEQHIANEWWIRAGSRIDVSVRNRYNVRTWIVSDLILTAFQRRLKNKDEDIEKYIEGYIKRNRYYTESNTGRLTKEEKEDIKEEVKKMRSWKKACGYYVGSKVYFTYIFGCETEREYAYAKENYKEGQSLNEKVKHAPYGVITKVDLKNGRFQVKLLKAIENDRVIVFDKYKRKPYIHSYRQYEPYYNGGTAGKYFMNVGDKMWFSMCISIWDPYYWFTKNMLKEYYDD